MPRSTARRTFLQAGAVASLAVAARAAGAQAQGVSAGASKTYVLVHGSWCGGWFFDPVADRLRVAGHRVFTPTQTGLGERKHLLTRDITLDTFIEDLVNVLEYEELRDVILVGHSAAGGPIPGVVDRMPDRIRHVVYLAPPYCRMARACSARLRPKLSRHDAKQHRKLAACPSCQRHSRVWALSVYRTAQSQTGSGAVPRHSQSHWRAEVPPIPELLSRSSLPPAPSD